jgi:hypothetical protein
MVPRVKDNSFSFDTFITKYWKALEATNRDLVDLAEEITKML